MKYLKKFENFDYESPYSPEDEYFDDEKMDLMGSDESEEEDDFFPEEEEEITEGLTAKQKKLPKALQDAILKKAGKKPKKDDEDEDDDKKSKKKEDKEDKDDKKSGLTAAQKKLPKALQDAILKKQKK